MSTHENTESPDDEDVEAAFYRLLAMMQDDAAKMLLDIRKDTFDASSGMQIGITSDGNVAILLVVNPHTTKMVHDAFEGVVDHNCKAGSDTIFGFHMYTHALIKSIIPRLPCAIQETKFFTHGDTEGTSNGPGL